MKKIQKLLAFWRMARLLYTKFFVAEGTHDSFPVIELGPFKGSGETYSLVYLAPGEYPQHIHDKSDAKFLFHSGEGVVVLGSDKTEVDFTEGSVIEAPRGTPHGFKVTKAGIFVAWQSSPITNLTTGERDARYDVHLEAPFIGPDA